MIKSIFSLVGMVEDFFLCAIAVSLSFNPSDSWFRSFCRIPPGAMSLDGLGGVSRWLYTPIRYLHLSVSFYLHLCNTTKDKSCVAIPDPTVFTPDATEKDRGFCLYDPRPWPKMRDSCDMEGVRCSSSGGGVAWEIWDVVGGDVIELIRYSMNVLGC